MQAHTTPQPFPLAQLAAMADKQTLACIAGTIKSIWQPKSGTNATGEWSIQNATIKGTDGTEIGLWLKDRDTIPMSAKGRFIILTARMTDKGLTGLYVMDDDYNGKVTRKIKVTPSAEIAYSDEMADQSAAAEPQQQQQTDHVQTSLQDPPPSTRTDMLQSQTRQPQTHNEAKALLEAQRTILQIANLHLQCARCVETYEAARFKQATGSDMTESQRQGAIASIFIESCRSGLVRSMPAKPME